MYVFECLLDLIRLLIKDYILNAIDDTIHSINKISFCANLAIVTENKGHIEMLYLGKGKLLKSGNYSIETAHNAYASLYKKEGIWYYSSDSDLKIIIDGRAFSLSAGYNQEIK